MRWYMWSPGISVPLLYCYWQICYQTSIYDDLPAPKMLLNFVSAIMLLVMAINIEAFNIEGFVKLTDAAPSTQPSSQQTKPPSLPGEVAEALNRSGIEPGDVVENVPDYASLVGWHKVGDSNYYIYLLTQQRGAN
jgi:hypothetical protein